MNHYYLLGRAQGVLDCQPLSGELNGLTLGAYSRYAEKWAENPNAWDSAPPAMRRFVMAGVRSAALGKLAVAAQALRSAMDAGEEQLMATTSQDIERCLVTLQHVRPARRGKRRRDKAR